MRRDQIERLQDLAEKIGDVFLEEADPNEWSGAGEPLAGMDANTRGDRYWCKKNAIQTGSLLARVLDLRDRDSRSVDAKMPEKDAEGEIKQYEKQARDLLSAIQSGAAAGKR